MMITMEGETPTNRVRIHFLRPLALITFSSNGRRFGVSYRAEVVQRQRNHPVPRKVHQVAALGASSVSPWPLGRLPPGAALHATLPHVPI